MTIKRLKDLAFPYCEEIVHLMKIGFYFNRKEKNKRYKFPSKISGIYFICLKDGTALYVGETGSCIKSRIRNHKRSMNEPEWPIEKSGKKFHNVGLQDEEFMVKYISSEELEISSKKERLLYESLLCNYVNPIIYGD